MGIEWEQVYTAYGQLDAAMIIDFLAAQGIEATAMQESIGTTYGLTVGPLGESRIYVRSNQKSEAITILKSMEKGDFILPDNSGDESGEP
jgi:hypothetical protein